MRPWTRTRLRVVASVLLTTVVGVGVSLILIRGTMPTNAVDCGPPPGYTSGGYRCFTMGHPYVPIGIVLIVGGIGLFGMLWSRSSVSRERRRLLRGPFD